MPDRMKARTANLLTLAALVSALAIAGCGGGDGGGSSDSTDPASLAPPDSLFFLEVTRPKGKAAADVEALAEKIAGIDDLGELIVDELESSALEDGDEVDYAKEIEPWLGNKVAFFPQGYDGDDFSGGGAALQTTDAAEAEQFLQERIDASRDPVREESYEGVDYNIDSDDGSMLGMIGDFVAYAEDEETFKAMVDASEGDSLAEVASYTKGVAGAPKEAVASVWVDIGGLVEADSESIDSDARAGLKLLGIEPKGATAVASAIPGSDQIEVDLSSDVATEVPPAEDNSFLLGSMPGDSVVALAASGAGEALANAIDQLDREGIPDNDIKPGEFKSAFKQAGIDLDSITSSITNVAAFAEGDTESSLGGAAVFIASSAQETVTDLGAFLRATGVDGFTQIKGKVSGFSIRDPDLGSKPLVVLADDGIHLVVAYGLRAARNYFQYDEELGDNPVFEEATASLDGLPIAGFADGPAALRLALSLVSGEDREGLLEARPYLSKIDFLALASESTEDLAKAKLVVGIGK
jgi:Protein of unknown function (DUF3352)